MPSLLSLPAELQVRIFGYAACDMNFAILPSPPANASPAVPFAFEMRAFSSIRNKEIFANSRAAVIFHIVNSADRVRIYIEDMNFDNTILLLQAIDNHGRMADFVSTEHAGLIRNARCRLHFIHTATTKFPKGGARLKAFSKFVEALTPAPGSHLCAAHCVSECESIEVLDEFSLKFSTMVEKFGQQFDSVLRAVRKELAEDLERKREQEDFENAEMIEMSRNGGWTDVELAAKRAADARARGEVKEEEESDVEGRDYDSDENEYQDELEKMLDAML